MGAWKEKLTEFQRWLQEDKHIRIAVICGLGLVLLLFLWGLVPKKTESSLSETDLDAWQYQHELEQRTASLLEQIDGVGSLSVMITLENDYETVYQTNDAHTRVAAQTERREEADTTVAEVDNQALVRTGRLPTVMGIAVVCEGGEEAIVQRRVTDTVTALFSISSTKVSVVAGTTDP